MTYPKIFVINLKRSVDRRKHMEKILSEIPMEVEFVEAIDAKELKNEDITNDIIDVNGCIGNKIVGCILTKPTVCCALSHIKTWKLIQKQNLKDAFIMEDDIIIKNKTDFLKILENKDKFSKDWEVVSFYSCKKRDEISIFHKKKIFNSYRLVRYTELSTGALGYLIDEKGIHKLLSQVLPISMHIDCYTGNNEIVNMYGIEPAIIEEDKYFGNKSDRQKSSMTNEEHKEYYKHLRKYINNEKINKMQLPYKKNNIKIDIIDFFENFLDKLRILKFFKKYMPHSLRRLIRSFSLKPYKISTLEKRK